MKILSPAMVCAAWLVLAPCPPRAAGAPAQPDTSTTPAAAPVARAGEPQRWKGEIELPGVKLEFVALLTPAQGDAPAAGTLDIPMQGLKDGPLSEVVVSDERIAFVLALPQMPPQAHARFSAAPAPDGQTAKGELRQSGGVFPVSMTRIAPGAAVGPLRPQEPKPPFPYTQRDVIYVNAQDGTTLAGTLTIPPGDGPHPVAVLITGSGPQDRDETILGHKPFWVLADHLSRRGIAVLRSDDRGVGGSSGSTAQSTAHDFAGDVLAAVAFLHTQPEIDAGKIGVIGHSEGGIVGPIAASKSADIAFVVILAGTGINGRDILTLQSAAIMRASGIGEDQVAAVTAHHGALMDLLERHAPQDEVIAATKALIVSQRRAGGAEPLSDGDLAAAAQQAIASMDNPWFRSFLLLDPREALRRVKAPVLAIIGSLDTQVPPAENLPEIEKALRDGGNRDVTAKELPGLNHLFQTAVTGAPAEYAMIEETFAPAALDEIARWIRARTGLDQ
ncbi:MAG: alpha/beta fold hydrolase [Phycisphaeraceae bacterium]|nr:alpha/beta fold hydrolase [Phycisphaeraceae bacterium]